jgi:hypothetical protein
MLPLVEGRYGRLEAEQREDRRLRRSDGIFDREHDIIGDFAILPDESEARRADNQAIVIPETIHAIRARSGWTPDGARSMAKTNASLGIGVLGSLREAG